MQIPPLLQQAIDAELSIASARQAAIAQAPLLSRRYREGLGGRSRPFIATHEDALAYALARMPATYGAAYMVLRETLAALALSESVMPDTLLDAGAGTGAACWAADALFSLKTVTCIEAVPAMGGLGEKLMRVGPPALRNTRWISADITEAPLPAAGLVIAAYVLNEITETKQRDTVLRLWRAAENILVLVEPGTPACFNRMKTLRQTLADAGAYILAPCSHMDACPLPDRDWCHFSARIPRSRAHKQAKSGEAPFEDEKYIYLAVSKTPVLQYAPRVLRHPARHKGYVSLSLCTETGLSAVTVTRAQSEAYARARKVQWGEQYEFLV
jgi:ribosomal protein RSM22 (predicted rRNA methylase)